MRIAINQPELHLLCSPHLTISIFSSQKGTAPVRPSHRPSATESKAEAGNTFLHRHPPPKKICLKKGELRPLLLHAPKAVEISTIPWQSRPPECTYPPHVLRFPEIFNFTCWLRARVQMTDACNMGSPPRREDTLSTLNQRCKSI